MEVYGKYPATKQNSPTLYYVIYNKVTLNSVLALRNLIPCR